MMVRLFRIMLPNTPMWRAMGTDVAPDVGDMTNEELVQSVELASHWKDPAVSTCTAPEQEQWNDNALDIFIGQENEGSWDTDANVVESNIASSSSNRQDASKMQVDNDGLDLRTVRFETPTPPPFPLANGQGSAHKPIVIDDSDDE